MSLYVFVYGTLRRGELNDIERLARHRGLAPPVRIGGAHVTGRLLDFGDWPGLIEDAAGRLIAGDVYMIDTDLLAMMDAVEEYSPGKASLFVRRSVSVCVDGLAYDCFFYPIDPALAGTATPIDHNDWIIYRKTRCG